MTPDTPLRRLAAAADFRGRVEITVDPEGGLALKTLGFTGSDCRTASRFLEEALGSVTTEKLLPGKWYIVVGGVGGALLQLLRKDLDHERR